jgi:hypothetical protein
MKRPGLGRFTWGLVAGGLVVAVAFTASAKDDDRAIAEATVKEVEAAPSGKALAQEPLARAHEALDRAQRLRDVRDEPRARLADGLARTWAETARDIVKAAEAETRAKKAREESVDAGAQVDRERALLEEGLGQAGRLAAQLEALEREAKHGPDRTSNVASDAGAGTPAKGPAKDAKKDAKGSSAAAPTAAPEKPQVKPAPSTKAPAKGGAK